MASNDEKEIRELCLSWAEAARRQDMIGVLSRHTEDVIMFDVPMPIQSRGLKEYQATWEAFFSVSPGGAGSFDLTELQITAGESAAYCHALVTVGDSTARLTLVLCIRLWAPMALAVIGAYWPRWASTRHSGTPRPYWAL